MNLNNLCIKERSFHVVSHPKATIHIFLHNLSHFFERTHLVQCQTRPDDFLNATDV